MERYGQVVVIAMPFFFALILFEKFYGMWKGDDRSPLMDMITGISSGLTNAIKDVLGLSLVILSYPWMLRQFAVMELQSSVMMYVIVFMVLDFQGYWTHRWAHTINIFWNKHLVHHSSEEYNLAVALRQSISSLVQLFTFFLLPAAILGIPHLVIATVAPIHLFAQFWYHTQHIGKLGFLEHIIVTPSHHRVHHAINPEYLDKNYSQIFIFWDKLFGTFQEEMPDVPAVYGITRPVQTWNPIKINFQHLWLLMKDAWRAKSWKDKARIWFMPTGWRPADVAEKYPVHKIENVYAFAKYQPSASKQLTAWSVFQLAVVLLCSAHLFSNIMAIGSPGIFYYGFFLFLSVYSMSELMDKNKYALGWEALRWLAGLGLLYVHRGWFGLNAFIPQAEMIMVAYLTVSLLVSLYFTRNELQEGREHTQLSHS